MERALKKANQRNSKYIGESGQWHLWGFFLHKNLVNQLEIKCNGNGHYSQHTARFVMIFQVQFCRLFYKFIREKTFFFQNTNTKCNYFAEIFLTAEATDFKRTILNWYPAATKYSKSFENLTFDNWFIKLGVKKIGSLFNPRTKFSRKL